MRGGGGEDLRLETHELPQMVRVPAPAGVRTAAQHTRVRTGRIHEHAVEDAFGGGLRHRDPIEPEACQIVLETPQPLRIHFLRDEPSRAAEAPGDLRGLAARGGTEIEDAEAGFHVQQIDGKRRRGILHEERTLRVPLDLGDLPPPRQLHKRTDLPVLRRLRRIGEPRLGGRVVPRRERLGPLGAVARDPAPHEGVRETRALRKRSGGELRLKFRAAADEVAQDAVHHTVESTPRATRLRGGDRLVDGREVRHVRHVEDLRRAHEHQRLQLALRPGLHQRAEDDAQGTEPSHDRVDEVLHERAVRPLLRQHLARKLVRRQPTGDDEGGGPPGILHG